jgi:hypothetical protein
MTLETLVENAAPVIESAKIPEYAQPHCDSWGNIKKEPLKVLEETHGQDFIKIFVYQIETGFFFGYQLKLKKLIIQKQANIKDTPLEGEGPAIKAARKELTDLASENRLIKTFIMFDTICYNQPELF